MVLTLVDYTEEICNSTTEGTIDIDVSGGTGPYDYSWNNGESTQDLADLTGGTYTLTVTDVNGCADEISVYN